MNQKKVIILAFCCFLAAISIVTMGKKLYPIELREEIRVVPAKEIVKFLCLDHRGFAADFFFIKVNLHSGSLMWKPLSFQFDSEWAYGMMETITDLDPNYYVAYLFSGMGLIHNFNDVNLARPILEKGMKVFPQSWELPFWLGYDYYVYLEEYALAGEYLWQAAQKPDSPKRFLALLLSVFRKGGSYEKALWALSALLDGTHDKGLRMVYEKKLVQLQNLSNLQKSANRYKEIKGHFPSELKILIQEKLIKKIPEDPMGMQYEWDLEKDRVVVR
ncbi:MAG: hypothetical protein JRE28_14700 [Deltaproteobacteria bacterium]|nr:hypothetical protein [Deltaproteobacteria bacterium]